MKKIFVLTVMISSVFVNAEIWKDYDLAEEVTKMTVVQVKPGSVDDYLLGIKKTWVDSCNLQIELGHIKRCGVWTAETAGTTPNVFLFITYENLAAMGPNKEKYTEFVSAWRNKISEEDQEQIAGGYDDIREIIDLVVLRKVNFN